MVVDLSLLFHRMHQALCILRTYLQNAHGKRFRVSFTKILLLFFAKHFSKFVLPLNILLTLFKCHILKLVLPLLRDLWCCLPFFFKPLQKSYQRVHKHTSSQLTCPPRNHQSLKEVLRFICDVQPFFLYWLKPPCIIVKV